MNFLIFIIIFIGIFVCIIYLKNKLLYRPLASCEAKYERFYRRLVGLVGQNKFVVNFMVTTSDNFILDAFHIINKESKHTIIFFRGNSGNVSTQFDLINFLYNYGSIIIFDYRSFGRSSGLSHNLSEESFHEDSVAVWKHCIMNANVCVDPYDISFFGESFGSCVAVNLLAYISKTFNDKFYPRALILNSPLYSLSSIMIHYAEKYNIRMIGKLISIFVGQDFKTNEAIPYINKKTKIIVAHSMRDEIIPFDQGLSLYLCINKICPDSKFIIINGTHNNMSLTEKYIYTLANIFA